MEAAAGLGYSPCSMPGMDTVQYTFKTAADNGFTVARVFAHGVNATLALQTSPGTEPPFKPFNWPQIIVFLSHIGMW